MCLSPSLSLSLSLPLSFLYHWRTPLTRLTLGHLEEDTHTKHKIHIVRWTHTFGVLEEPWKASCDLLSYQKTNIHWFPSTQSSLNSQMIQWGLKAAIQNTAAVCLCVCVLAIVIKLLCVCACVCVCVCLCVCVSLSASPPTQKTRSLGIVSSCRDDWWYLVTLINLFPKMFSW